MSDGKFNVLVVDDNTEFLQLLDLALGNEFRMITASDGKEGLKKAVEERPDIILMDVMMPGVSGIEMLRSLLAEEETRNIPVLVLTATKFDPSTETLFSQESNVKGFFSKPCPLNVIKEQILKHAKK